MDPKDICQRVCQVVAECRGAWVAQLVKRLTLAQVMISTFVGLSPVLGSVLTAQSLEPALDPVSSSFSAPPWFTLFIAQK